MDKLIIKLLNNTISKEELDILASKLEKPSNRKKLEEFLKVDLKLNQVSLDTNIDEALAKVLHCLHDEKPTKNQGVFTLKRYRHIAVAASLTLLVSIGYYFFNGQEPTPIDNSNTVVTRKITAGSNKAILTFSNGEQIALEKGKPFQENEVTSTGENLEYKKGTLTKEELKYNEILIPRGGQFVVTLSDNTKVWLNSASKLRYPVKFAKGSPRAVELMYGEAYFDVSPSEEHNGNPFVVNNNHLNIEVVGTEFNVKAYEDDARYTTSLVEGKVAISSKDYGKMLAVGEKAIIDIATGDIKIAKADLKLETAWKDGLFVFKGETLGNMMKVLSRWYNVTIEFKDVSKANLKFSGNLSRTENLEELLKRIALTQEVEFLMKNSTTIIVE